MLNAENKINAQQTTPWSPELNTAIRTVTLWKLTLTQLKTKISQHKSITTIQQALTTTIDLTWNKPLDIITKLKLSKHNIIHIRRDANQLRTRYLLQRASVLKIAKNKTARNTIINIKKIEQIIRM